MSKVNETNRGLRPPVAYEVSVHVAYGFVVFVPATTVKPLVQNGNDFDSLANLLNVNPGWRIAGIMSDLEGAKSFAMLVGGAIYSVGQEQWYCFRSDRWIDEPVYEACRYIAEGVA